MIHMAMSSSSYIFHLLFSSLITQCILERDYAITDLQSIFKNKTDNSLRTNHPSGSCALCLILFHN